jgi:hypothetical protein
MPASQERGYQSRLRTADIRVKNESFRIIPTSTNQFLPKQPRGSCFNQTQNDRVMPPKVALFPVLRKELESIAPVQVMEKEETGSKSFKWSVNQRHK